MRYFIFVLIFLPIICFADTIYFKDGRLPVMSNKVREQGDYVFYQESDVEVMLSRDEIDRIERGLTIEQKRTIEIKKEDERLTPPEEYEKIIQAWMKESLFDPYSVRDLEIREPLETTTRSSIFGLEVGQKVWVVAVKFNAKNRYGAYTGLKTHLFYFRGEKFVGVLD